jgi:hypothetical protein
VVELELGTPQASRPKTNLDRADERAKVKERVRERKTKGKGEQGQGRGKYMINV